MLYNDNAPLADTAFFTIVRNYVIRREAVVAAAAVTVEETCFSFALPMRTMRVILW